MYKTWDNILKKMPMEEIDLIGDIAGRAKKMNNTVDIVSAQMDITLAHSVCPLKLDELLAADDFNFIHDVAGIMRHIDRETGQLKNCFYPRFSK